jgi:hypothetical protein
MLADIRLIKALAERPEQPARSQARQDRRRSQKVERSREPARPRNQASPEGDSGGLSRYA